MGYHGWEIWDFDEDRDGKAYKVWLYDGKDSFPMNKPLDLWRHIAVAEHPAMQYGPEMLSLPSNRGWDWRLKGALEYFTVIETTEEERRQREPIFRERIAPWIEDFEGEWRGKTVPIAVEHFEQLRKANVEKLNDIELKEHFEEWLRVSDLIWKRVHFLPFNAVFNIYLLFEELCRELLSVDDANPLFKALMSGFDNRIYQTDRALWRLGDRARELGLGKTFLETADDEELLSRLSQNEAGRQWLLEFDKLLQQDGWRCPGHVASVSMPSWVEKPSLAIPPIRQAIVKGGAFALDKERERLVRQREQAEKDLLSRVPRDRRDWFDKLLKAAQWQGRWNEEHQFYAENYFNALGRRVTKEIGKRFAQAGAIEHAEDIYFLLPEEIKARIIGRRTFNALPLIEIRKRQYEEYVKAEPPPPFIGDPNEIGRLALVCPIVRVLLVLPVVKPELKADLYGAATAPGVIEGTARVIFSEEQFPLVQPGDILVTVMTNPMWTALFSIVKGVVTDYGGSLSHAVIVGREYGLPVVAGTMEGTRKLKSGDKIRVDGDLGAVYILQKRQD